MKVNIQQGKQERVGDGDVVMSLAQLEQKINDAYERGRKESKQDLQFIWRWISRLNGDKDHDKPKENWKEYVAVLVNYPNSPYNTGDWFD